MTDLTFTSPPVRAARGPNDWNERATYVKLRERYWCQDTDLNCNYQEPHKHGVACDYDCNCKG